MGNLIGLHIELDAIRSFLITVLDAASSEYSKIQIRSNAGEFNHYDDEANAFFIPMMWEEIACRSTLGELNALVEWELQTMAIIPFSEKKEKASNTKKSKLVYDLYVGDVIQLIEKHYQIKINEIDSYDVVKDIRNKVNSFKHRKGFKHPLKDRCKVIPERFEVSRSEALRSIDLVRDFFIDLWSKTNDKK
ncbi:hypothetical protein KA005_57900, partial [bacterium]|nr:hypothetical protein [bacterium]